MIYGMGDAYVRVKYHFCNENPDKIADTHISMKLEPGDDCPYCGSHFDEDKIDGFYPKWRESDEGTNEYDPILSWMNMITVRVCEVIKNMQGQFCIVAQDLYYRKKDLYYKKEIIKPVKKEVAIRFLTRCKVKEAKVNKVMNSVHWETKTYHKPVYKK